MYSNKTIAFQADYLNILDGDINSALLLSQIVYWYLPSKKTGKSKLQVFHKGYWWLVKSHKDWEHECGLTRHMSDRSLGILKNLGIIDTMVFPFNGTPKNHVRLMGVKNILQAPPTSNEIVSLAENEQAFAENEQAFDDPEQISCEKTGIHNIEYCIEYKQDTLTVNPQNFKNFNSLKPVYDTNSFTEGLDTSSGKEERIESSKVLLTKSSPLIKSVEDEIRSLCIEKFGLVDKKKEYYSKSLKELLVTYGNETILNVFRDWILHTMYSGPSPISYFCRTFSFVPVQLGGVDEEILTQVLDAVAKISDNHVTLLGQKSLVASLILRYGADDYIAGFEEFMSKIVDDYNVKFAKKNWLDEGEQYVRAVGQRREDELSAKRNFEKTLSDIEAQRIKEEEEFNRRKAEEQALSDQDTL